ncbi:MAG: oligosaccharide flippase family protein [Cyclobacteriaceae bacterium]|nr:oligosaccharide flippase family protein [Cyclobacteriaceae bacterium]
MNIRKLKQLLTFLSFTSFDTSTEEGRSKERYRRSALTTLGAVAAKAINFLIFTVSIPLTINYLGKERFGLWMTMSSMIIMLTIVSDLGLGIALMNKVSELNGLNNKALIRKNVSNGFFLLVGIATLLLISYGFIYFFFLDWTKIFQLQNTSNFNEVNHAMNLLITIFCFNLPFTIVDKFQEANQEGYLSSLWQSAGNFFGFIAILIVVKYQLGLVSLIAATFGIPTLIRVINFIYLSTKRRTMKPTLMDFDKTVVYSLLSVGFVFFLLNLLNMVGMHSDSFIISSTLSVSEAGLYGVVQKFSLAAFILWAFTNSLWPAYTEALAKEDFSWVKKTIRRNLLISGLLGLLIAMILLVIGKPIVSVLSKEMLKPDFGLLLGFGVYILVQSFVSCFATIFNASFLYKKQVIYFAIASCVSFVLKFLLSRYCGVSGVIWATSIGYGLFYVLPAFFLVSNLFNKTKIL